MTVRAPLTMQQRGTGRRGEVEISGTILVGAAGAVTSFACEYMASGGVVKNAAAGRYDLLFVRKFKNIRVSPSPSITGPASAAFGNTAGNLAQWRPATAGFMATLQVFLASTGADTDTTGGNIINFSLVAQEI